ncbi:hypothetical protein GCM10025771_37200 [Niveibacterium umoris]|uniref:Uncharacterized protein n=1 Tax=Niveibacterium umoris TaxID=1193620 RepID=A0A840BHK7_9RHOO|nr:hypothetical protein [Niveibacterium umoris]MBB4011082.1 hypothetical protein [Niveibacterium umoris]
MLPWLWLWQPTWNLPLSGSVSQDLAPDVIANGFFSAIPSGAGEGALEQKIFEQVSYGSQLGWLTDLVLAASGSDKVPAEKVQEARAALEGLRAQIVKMKDAHREQMVAEARRTLDALKARGDGSLDSLLKEYR